MKKGQHIKNVKDLLTARMRVKFTADEYAVIKEIAEMNETSMAHVVREAVYETYRRNFKRRIDGFNK